MDSQELPPEPARTEVPQTEGITHRIPSDPGYILVDLDHTMAQYTTWEEQKSVIGRPVPAMVARVSAWLQAGKDVRVFTARASGTNPRQAQDTEEIRAWTEEVFGVPLEVTNQKCFRCVAIWDDLAVTVEANTGWRLTHIDEENKDRDPLWDSEGKYWPGIAPASDR